MTDTRDHLLSILVRDEPRVLTRITALFGRRGYNIKSLSVGSTENPGVSRMTIVVSGDRGVVEQAIRQLEKLHDVVRIIDHSLEKYVDRELVLVKVAITPESRVEVRQIAEDFRSRIVDVGRHALTLHDEREQREHLSQREAEHGHAGNRRNEVPDAALIHDGDLTHAQGRSRARSTRQEGERPLQAGCDRHQREDAEHDAPERVGIDTAEAPRSDSDAREQGRQEQCRPPDMIE